MRMFRTLASARTMLNSEELAVLRGEGKRALVFRDGAGGTMLVAPPPGTEGFRDRGTWSAGKLYRQDDLVLHNGTRYRAWTDVVTGARVTELVDAYIGVTAHFRFRVFNHDREELFAQIYNAGSNRFNILITADNAYAEVVASAQPDYGDLPGTFSLVEENASGVYGAVYAEGVTQTDLSSWGTRTLWAPLSAEVVEPGVTPGWDSYWGYV